MQAFHDHHLAAVESVERLMKSSERVCFTFQNIAEFWCVATRPVANNGLGCDVAQVMSEVAKIESSLELLPETESIYPEWRRIVATFKVKGVQVHDARLVAAMNVHNVSRLLTFNISDFARYGVETMHPALAISG